MAERNYKYLFSDLLRRANTKDKDEDWIDDHQTYGVEVSSIRRNRQPTLLDLVKA